MRKGRIVFATIFGTVLVIGSGRPQASFAALIAYDSFSTDATPNNGDYNAAPLVGTNPQNPTVGLSGFTNAWFGSASTGANRAHGGGGLTHPTLTGSVLNGRVVPILTVGDSSNFRRVFRAINYTPAPGTYYMSFLMQKAVATNTYDELMGLAPTQPGNYTESSWETSPGGIYLGIYNGGVGFYAGNLIPTTTLLSAANTIVGETYMGILRIFYSGVAGGDSVQVQILDSTAQDVAGGTFSSLTLNIPNLSVATRDRNSTTVMVDEFRFGTELADVYLIPEPSSLLLLILGVSCLLVFRGKRPAIQAL